jgi:hypothetical protein
MTLILIAAAWAGTLAGVYVLATISARSKPPWDRD